jgi:hypothetical protein
VNAESSRGNEPKRTLSLTQAARYLGISKAHLSNVIRGKVEGVPPLHFAKVGRRLLFRTIWLDEWLDDAGQRSVFSRW